MGSSPSAASGEPLASYRAADVAVAELVGWNVGGGGPAAVGAVAACPDRNCALKEDFADVSQERCLVPSCFPFAG